jgi:ketosteroid isomerase-like protein
MFSSAGEVEAAFYQALARSDLDSMMRLWSEDDDVVCIHPDGPRLVGLGAVRESWRLLFSSGVRLIVRTAQPVVSASMLLSVHNLIEHIAVEGEERMHPPMVATNAYVRGPMGWRMVMHHASPAPDLLTLSQSGGPSQVH